MTFNIIPKSWFKGGQLSAAEFWLCSIIPMGQLYARVEIMDGSINHAWTMFPLFMVPPFQFVPIIMMNLGIIKKGQGGKPYDWYMLIPMMVQIFLSMIKDKGVVINNTILFFVSYFAILIPFLIRSLRYCQGFDMEGLLNSGGLSIYVLAVVNIFQLILPFIPIIGGLANSLKMMVPSVGSAMLWTLSYIPGYVLANMYSGSDTKKYCMKFNYSIWTIVVSLAIAFSTS